MYPRRVVNDGITIAPVRSATSIGPVGLDTCSPMNGTTIRGPSISRSAISTTTPPCFSVRITRFTFPTLTGANVCPLPHQLRVPEVRAHHDHALPGLNRRYQQFEQPVHHQALVE